MWVGLPHQKKEKERKKRKKNVIFSLVNLVTYPMDGWMDGLMDDVKPHKLYYQEYLNQKEGRKKGIFLGKENTKDFSLRLKYTPIPWDLFRFHGN
jgi:hypothetical protein